ncbi:adenylosuccinate synthetase : Adenylosuccinate synthetase OS=Oscillochloris trichoides DG-6 GN=purA PE=3 SV=1: Adenylsucc_synt [Gemmataceae bacterium]|nr:adenylosuccinate synthetase : Adenylosuccinate synthetase OS=Oscillochloris trichoides DG-6 GN=purA PE=3 SV=1: Adenylsucc_synt [Gemmataceae bacterium]VTT99138.1 adenylosuccinate synthetase : Adenylosuccinate synthetase OS=Oscillochloris trichoides DG-6 GN=purA PE=3 SV=1: Adenylsucc_synt [Gemmataceae bacterium]
MRRAVITVGLGFGDEGKGATVDFLTRDLGADLVVRYCGGSQAGHNVELPDGRRHTFSQFGAGTLAPSPAKTYLGPACVIDPPAMLREARHLAELGVRDPLRLATVHPDCLVATPWLRLLNRARELARGDARHGSCGQGVGEARSYWLRYGRDAVTAGDLRAPDALAAKLELQRQRVLLELQPVAEACDPVALRELVREVGELSAADAARELCESAFREVAVSADVPPHRTAILEGAQGVLLDEYRGFHPFTTWSTVTAHHAWEMVERLGSEAVSVLGLTRAYHTRHGAGPLPTHSADLTAKLPDPGNPWNAWQGTLRCGWLDLVLLRYAVGVTGPLDGIVVNHLDHVGTGFRLCDSYEGGELVPSAFPDLAWQARLTAQVQAAKPVLTPAGPDDVVRALGSVMAPVVIRGSGPTHRDRQNLGLTFRKRRASA